MRCFDASCSATECPHQHQCRRCRHWLLPSAFGTKSAARKAMCVTCSAKMKVDNAINNAKWTAINNAKSQAENAKKRAEEASFLGFNVTAAAPPMIASAKDAYKQALARFDGKYIDVYAFVASTGSGDRYSLKNESINTIFSAKNPILRSSKWSAKGSGECLVPHAERFSINNSDHVFEMANAGRGVSGKELAHRIEKALHIFGEQHAAASGGRIKPLWRGHGKGYPKGIGPYKVGLLVIERDAAGRLPFGWKRTDGK